MWFPAEMLSYLEECLQDDAFGAFDVFVVKNDGDARIEIFVDDFVEQNDQRLRLFQFPICAVHIEIGVPSFLSRFGVTAKRGHIVTLESTVRCIAEIFVIADSTIILQNVFAGTLNRIT